MSAMSLVIRASEHPPLSPGSDSVKDKVNSDIAPRKWVLKNAFYVQNRSFLPKNDPHVNFINFQAEGKDFGDSRTYLNSTKFCFNRPISNYINLS